MIKDAEMQTRPEDPFPQISTRKALSSGWQATVGALGLGWRYILFLIGGTAIAGIAYGLSSDVFGEYGRVVSAAILAFSISVSFSQLTRISVSLAIEKPTLPRRWFDSSKIPTSGIFVRISEVARSTISTCLVIVTGLLHFNRLGMALGFAVSEELSVLDALRKSWGNTAGKSTDLWRVAGFVTVSVASCLLLSTGALAFLYSESGLSLDKSEAVRWVYSILLEMVFLTGLAWLHASAAALDLKKVEQVT